MGSDAEIERVRVRYGALSNEDIAKLHAAGPSAFRAEAWQLLEAEFRARGLKRSQVPPESLKPVPDEAAISTPDDLPPAPHGPLVTVFAGNDWVALTTAKLLLEAEGIRFVVQGEGVQDLFGLGRLGAGYNLITGPVQLRVAADEAPWAVEVLRDLRESTES